MRFALLLILTIWFQSGFAWAQSGDRRGDSRDRGGSSGGRSSGEGQRGERSDRGDRGGSDENSGRSRGSRWGGGGFDRGNFSGGQGGFSGPFGGGGFGGGSPFGGGLGDMIRRFDRNANNMIDPDEVVGPAGFFLQRMAQSNPKIDPSRPIPIDLILGEVDRFRGGMMGGAGPGSGEDDAYLPAANEPELLVPDFRLPSNPEPIQGFGSVSTSGSRMPVNDRDKAEAEERLRRYDRNRDGFLTPDELSQGRWSGDPMQFDRNRDGRLSIEELASRQAERRAQEAGDLQPGSNASSPRPGEWGSGMAGGWSRGTDPNAQGGNRNGDNEQEGGSPRKNPQERFGDARSYRIATPAATTDPLPSFFLSSDGNGDGQITLKEFAAVISEQTLAEFGKWDLNADGLITRREAVASNRSGGSVASSAESEAAPPARDTSPPTRASAPASPSADSSSAASGQPPSRTGKYSDAEFEWAKRQIKRYDADGDGVLARSEWEKMVVKPFNADTNRDGKITVEEYATHGALKR